MSLGLGVRYWVDSSDSGPHGWGVRLVVTFLFPNWGLRFAATFLFARWRQIKSLLTNFTVPMPSVPEHMAAGKALRGKVPHDRHAEFRPHPKRPDPVSILQEQAKTRLPLLVPIRQSDGMEDAVARFAAAYAEQTDRDCDALVKAAEGKRIPVAKVAE